MLLTYCAVKIMEILKRKNSFPELPEISVLRHYFSYCVSREKVAFSSSLG
jgi:hypothetical protein